MILFCDCLLMYTGDFPPVSFNIIFLITCPGGSHQKNKKQVEDGE